MDIHSISQCFAKDGCEQVWVEWMCECWNHSHAAGPMPDIPPSLLHV
jgi:hypothetical protein